MGDAMEKIAYELKDLLHKKLGLYQDLMQIMEKERGILKAMDVDALWDTSAGKKKIVAEIRSLRKAMTGLVEENGLEFKADPHQFNPAALVRSIPVSGNLKAELSRLAFQVNNKKQEVNRLAFENRRNISEYLKIVSGLIATMMGSPDRHQYSGKGTLGKTDRSNYMIRAEV